MIVYSATKKEFTADVLANEIEKKILSSFVREMGHPTGKREIASWQNSMLYMNNIISDSEIPEDAGIAIEYKIPQTSKRIDFILTGVNEENRDVAVLIELKQWEKAELTDLDGIVQTYVGGSTREVSHPSYQVWSYAALLEDFNSNVQDNDIGLHPCAYLHNYERDDVILNEFYKDYIDRAPVFLRSDSSELRDFIKRFVKYGDKNKVLYQIENGRIRPSKQLADSLSSMLAGNQEFVLIDDQKLVYETALKLAREATDEVKNVLIVTGGPGTGKSVVAINLLVELTNRGLVAQYVTRNSAPRKVYEAKLTGKISRSRISNMFTSSGAYTEIKNGEIDALVVDEAHRLNEKSGLYSNRGENQIKEIMDASKFSVFFLDEDQRVTMSDIGTKAEIKFWANRFRTNIIELDLASQFRCNGSDGYIAWLDNVLDIRATANVDLEGLDFDFRVIDSPSKLHEMIREKNLLNNKSRVVAGYCWKWPSKKDPQAIDIEIGDYKVQWNLDEHGQAWIIQPDSIEQVGCIHTCQGLELDYVGVIIGPDLIVRDGKIIADASKRASSDKSVYGYKKMLAKHPEQAKAVGEMIVKNTYKTLMTRGMKGCYIYCTDPETQEYFRQALKKPIEHNLFTSDEIGASYTE
jgi:DUF2075 family protein